MSLLTIVTTALLFAASSTIGTTLTDADVARFSHELLVAAGATDRIEHAAFVVRTPGGTLDLVKWPRGGFLSARWNGPIPKGAVAVIHTHPAKRPAPSSGDRAEARRIGLPFYVVSRAGLCVADDGGVSCARSIPWLRPNGMASVAQLDWTERAVLS